MEFTSLHCSNSQAFFNDPEGLPSSVLGLMPISDLETLLRCFSTDGPRSGTGPWRSSCKKKKKQLPGRGLTKVEKHCST
jgi:hypothetical protein